VYKRINPQGTAWAEYVIDARFEHHDGAHVIQLEDGYGIVSHAWKEAKYVHLWKRNSLAKVMSESSQSWLP
jgi:hypothetical protein